MRYLVACLALRFRISKSGLYGASGKFLICSSIALHPVNLGFDPVVNEQALAVLRSMEVILQQTSFVPLCFHCNCS
jgi:hypothetical protein